MPRAADIPPAMSFLNCLSMAPAPITEAITSNIKAMKMHNKINENAMKPNKLLGRYLSHTWTLSAMNEADVPITEAYTQLRLTSLAEVGLARRDTRKAPR